MSIDYELVWDEYWQKKNSGTDLADINTLSEQILSSCGFGCVLDIGSGSGELVACLLKKGIDAKGIDVSGNVVAECNKKIPDRFIRSSVDNIPFENGSFDTIVSINCLEFIDLDTIKKSVSEIYRVCKRFVFIRVDVKESCKSLEGGLRGRRWWESLFFETGFRKHFCYYDINKYESLNFESGEILFLMEKIPEETLKEYPLSALKNERDLHMDMLRETGSRSDAHVARYSFASAYVRPGDVVMDAACGLGYGSYLIHRNTKCASVKGIDGSAYGIQYAKKNFENSDAVVFEEGFLPECLGTILPESVDCIICFETLEHVEDPVALLTEFYRILTPGGRLICSVPNDWSDETGVDPNPYHLHVYTLEVFVAQLATLFDLEHIFAQCADRVKVQAGRGQWKASLRAIKEIDFKKGLYVEAEWLLGIVCKCPLYHKGTQYFEKAFTPEEQSASLNALAFKRDYTNPWIVRSLISVGVRTENVKLRKKWAEETLSTCPIKSADYGAALCVLIYISLSIDDFNDFDRLSSLIEKYLTVEIGENITIMRWQVSLSYAAGVFSLRRGKRALAESYFRKVREFPILEYSPTLLTKYGEASYIQGVLALTNGLVKEAKNIWSDSFRRIIFDLGRYFSSPNLSLPPDFELREISAAVDLAGKLVVAARYAEIAGGKPSILKKELNENYVSKIDWLEEQKRQWEKLAGIRENAITALMNQVNELQKGGAWLSKQRDAWERKASEIEVDLLELQMLQTKLLEENANLVKNNRELDEKVHSIQIEFGDMEVKYICVSKKIERIKSVWLFRVLNFICFNYIFKGDGSVVKEK